MKSVLILLSLITFSSASFGASKYVLPPTKVDQLRKALEKAAVRYHTPVANMGRAVDCMVSKITEQVTEGVDLKHAEKKLEWAIRYYDQSMSQDEADEDPLLLMDNLIADGGECIHQK